MKRTLCQFITVLFAAWFAGAVPSAFAKAYYATEDEMIERAEVIAIVNISRVEKAKTKAEPFNYNEIAQATVEQSLKGTLPKTVKLYGGEDFICAQVHFTPGRYLVFLHRAGEFLVGCNWHLSVRPIKDTQVEWYIAGERLNLSWQPLVSVLGRIKNPPAKPKAFASSAESPMARPTETTISSTRFTGITDLKRYANDEVALYHADGILHVHINSIPNDFLRAWGIAPPSPEQQKQQLEELRRSTLFASAPVEVFTRFTRTAIRRVDLFQGEKWDYVYSIGLADANTIHIGIFDTNSKFKRLRNININRSQVQAISAILDKYVEWVQITDKQQLTNIQKPIATVGDKTYSFKSPEILQIKLQQDFASDMIELERADIDAIKGLLTKIPEIEQELESALRNDIRSQQNVNSLLK